MLNTLQICFVELHKLDSQALIMKYSLLPSLLISSHFTPIFSPIEEPHSVLIAPPVYQLLLKTFPPQLRAPHLLSSRE